MVSRRSANDFGSLHLLGKAPTTSGRTSTDVEGNREKVVPCLQFTVTDNVAQLIGNLGRDPEVRSTQNGKVVSLSIATSESWKDKHTGERKERTEWHRVVLFNPGLCDLAEKYLVKGSKVFVEGQLKTRKWTDSDGVERYSTEIHLSAYNGTLTFLDSRRDTEGRGSSRDAWAGGGGSTGADLDGDIPFGPCWQ